MRGQASLGNYEANDVVVLRGDVNTRPNQPLFVLDGVIGVDATTIMDLDPGTGGIDHFVERCCSDGHLWFGSSKRSGGGGNESAGTRKIAVYL